MTALTRWLGSAVEADESGTATFSVAGTVMTIRLESFADAQALDALIATAEKLAAERQRHALVKYLQGAARYLESQS